MGRRTKTARGRIVPGLDTKKVFVILLLIVKTQRACFLLLNLYCAHYNRECVASVILFSDIIQNIVNLFRFSYDNSLK